MCISPTFIPYSDQGIGFNKGHTLTGVPFDKDYKNKRYVAKRGSLGFYVPCGKCPECLKAKQRQWYARFDLENRYWSKKNCFCYFCTFTYNDQNLPSSRDKAILDIQAFFKSLSRKFGFTPRFYITSEFGSNTNRLHYHALIFNVPNIISKDTIDGLLRKCWHRGFISVKPAAGKEFSYVSKYVTKDVVGYSGDWTPIQTFSKRPPLGLPNGSNDRLATYLNNGNDCLHIRGYTYPVPRYIRNKLLSVENQLSRKHDFIIKRGIDPHVNPVYRDDVLREYELNKQHYIEKKRKNIRKYEYLSGKGNKESQPEDTEV